MNWYQSKIHLKYSEKIHKIPIHPAFEKFSLSSVISYFKTSKSCVSLIKYKHELILYYSYLVKFLLIQRSLVIRNIHNCLIAHIWCPIAQLGKIPALYFDGKMLKLSQIDSSVSVPILSKGLWIVKRSKPYSHTLRPLTKHFFIEFLIKIKTQES